MMPPNGQISYCEFESEHRGNMSSFFLPLISLTLILRIYDSNVPSLESRLPCEV